MRSLLLPSLFVSACCAASLSEAASPSVESLSPGIGQRGTEFTLKLVGAGLEDAAELMLYSPGVVCEEVKAASDNELSVRLRAAADAPLGSHAFRVRTKHGLSELRTFRVTPLPVVSAEEPNESPSEARPVANNVTIAGVIESGDIDCFQVALKRGDRLAAEVEAIRFGGAMLDTVLAVFGPDGKQLAASDDTSLFRQDPFLTIIAAEDGPHVVQVRETSFEGDENSRYALHLGTFPRPAFVYPAGGRAGQTMSVRFGGDATGSFENEVRLPPLPTDHFGLFAVQQDQVSPTPNPFRVSPFDNVLESEPNDDPKRLTSSAAELPVAFNGILERAGDQDCFRFRGSPRTRQQFEVFASRLGSPLDSLISITDSTGAVLASNDDDGSHDSRLMFVAPGFGEYVLHVTDKRGAGGDGFVYRVEATEPPPGLAVFLPRPDRRSQDRQTIAVPRGNRVLMNLGIRRDGMDGEVQLVGRGLPSGVSFSEANLPPDRFWIPVVVEARADAPISGALAEVLATGKVDGQTVTGQFVQMVNLVSAPADASFQSIEVDRLAVAVVEESPLTVTLEEPKAALAQDGTIGFQIRVDRASGFEGPVDVAFPFLPPWVDGPPSITIPADQSSAIYTARAFPQVQPRTWRIAAEAKAGSPPARSAAMEAAPGAPSARPSRRSRSRSVSTVAVASSLVTLQVSKSPVTGAIGTVTAEQGKEIKLVCSLQSHGPLPKQMTATLEGLPNRVATSPVTVSSKDQQVTFIVKLEPTAPVGSFPSLVCRLTGTIDGQEVSCCVGRGGVLKIESAGALVTDATGRPLSPLEVLRRSQPRKADDKQTPSP
ncbi:MAG: hypothetical protein H7062_22735 [Candidatus Saccharimonas sp.]|nr:hypothetical protein [Planctomycetaceae bacterium]